MAIFRYLRHNENFANTLTFFERNGFWTKDPKCSAVQSPDE